MQPSILINDRWGRTRMPDGTDITTMKFGDFTTHEWSALEERPSGWWEYCRGWYGHWGYSGPFAGEVKPELEQLGKIRGWDGNYLLNLGPQPDGRLPEGTAAAFAEMAAWMRINGEAIHGTRGGPDGAANVPTTVTARCTYLHLFAAWRAPVELSRRAGIRSIRLLGREGGLDHTVTDNGIVIPAVGAGYRIIRVEWSDAGCP
jgi:alpha-L-fucosidase